MHVGGGKWHDPVLGRPLQPNANGSLPTVPQALNRFAATSLGQPGISQAVYTDEFNWIPSVASFVYGTTTQVVGKLHHIVGYKHTGTVLINAVASKSALTKFRRGNPLFSTPIEAFADGNRTFYRTTGLAFVAGNSQDELVAAAARAVNEIEDVLPKRAPWTAQVTGDLIGGAAQPLYSRFEDLARFKGGVAYIGAGLDFVIGAGFQLANDYGSPYLTSAQVSVRVGLAGTGSALFGYLGGSIGTLCGPVAVICIPVGSVVGGVVWSEWLQPLAFQTIPGLSPADRNLLPLVP